MSISLKIRYLDAVEGHMTQRSTEESAMRDARDSKRWTREGGIHQMGAWTIERRRYDPALPATYILTKDGSPVAGFGTLRLAREFVEGYESVAERPNPFPAGSRQAKEFQVGESRRRRAVASQRLRE